MELIAVTAAAHPGEGERYNTRQDAAIIDRYHRAARKAKALLVLDIQPGRSDFFTEATAPRSAGSRSPTSASRSTPSGGWTRARCPVR